VNEDAQAATVELLADPATYGIEGPVERFRTHGARVFLAGERAYKLKRAVKLPYLDYSTPERRQAACRTELAINRRTAPELYLGVLAVTRAPDGRLALDGTGEPVDWVVAMRRFDNDCRFDRLAERDALQEPLPTRLADTVARFHAGAERRPQGAGGNEMRRLVELNHAALPGWLGAAALDELRRRSLDRVGAAEALIEARRSAGWVRRGHGDLHLANIVLHEGRPLLFDAIEFDERLIDIDVLYDLAFLLMDLWQRGAREAACRVLSRYLLAAGGHEGLRLLPLFLSLRAAIRAHVSGTLAAEGEAGMDARCRAYFALAGELLAPPPPVLAAVGGLSGSGKSTVARAVAPALGAVPGAVVLRSDEVRKQLLGRPPESSLGPEGYTPQMHERVYAALAERAAAVLSAGHAVLVDAVHDRPDGRARLAAVAKAAGVPFRPVWLEAPAEALRRRVAGRRDDASDADAAVLERQLAALLPVEDWPRVDASGSPEATAGAVLAAMF